MRRRRQSATANIPPTHTRCRAPRDRGPSHRPRTGISAGAARPGEVFATTAVAARSMAVADGGRRLRQWSARSMRVTPSCPRPSAAPIARARGRSVEGTCVGRGATATRGRGRRGRALIVRAPSKPAGEFANAPLHRLGCSLGSTVRHGRGLGLAARGTSGRAVWSCVRRRHAKATQPSSHYGFPPLILMFLERQSRGSPW